MGCWYSLVSRFSDTVQDPVHLSAEAPAFPEPGAPMACDEVRRCNEPCCSSLLGGTATSGLLGAMASDAVRCTVFSACTCGEVLALRVSCLELALGTADRDGRLLAASAVVYTEKCILQR